MALAGGIVTNTNGVGIFNAVVNFYIDGLIFCDQLGRWYTLNGFSGMTVTASAPGFIPKTVVMKTIAYFPEVASYGLWEVIALEREQPQNGGGGGGGGW